MKVIYTFFPLIENIIRRITGLRLDLYLKVSRLINRRSKAKEMCDKGLIKVNGKISKPSHAVKVGDLIEIDFLNKFLKSFLKSFQ